MRRYRVRPEDAWPVADYDSSFRLSRLHLSTEGEVRVAIAYLSPGDWIGVHPAGLPQLFCVVAGVGAIQDGEGVEQPITAGEAVFWIPGERHGVRTEVGLTAVIVQAAALNPDAFLPSLGSESEQQPRRSVP